jgi:hypothetical protein
LEWSTQSDGQWENFGCEFYFCELKYFLKKEEIRSVQRTFDKNVGELMSSIEEREEIVAVGLCAVVLALEEEEKRKRRWYVRPINLMRPMRGEYETLIEDMRQLDDVEWKSEYFRMSAETLAILVQKVTPFLLRKPTHLLPISVEARVAFTVM